MVSVVAPIIQHHIEHSSDRTRASVRSFFQYFRTFYRLARWRFLLVPVAMVFSGIFESIGIILFFPLLERFQVGVASANMHPLLGRIDEMLRTIGIRSIGAILTFIASVFVVKFVIVFLQRVLIQRIRVDLYRHVANEIILGWSEADYARFYLRTTTGQASSILTNELWTFLAAFAMYAETLVNLVYLVVYFGALLFLDLNVTILALSAGGGVLLLFTRFIGLTKRYSIAFTAARRRYQERLIELMEHFKYLKATHRFPTMRTKLRSEIADMTKLQFRMGVISDLLASAAEPFVVLFVVALLVFQLIIREQPIGVVAVFVIMFYRSVTRVVKLQANWQKFSGCIGAVYVVLDALTGIREHAEVIGTIAPHALTHAIAFDHVKFSYVSPRSAGSPVEVLHDISLVIPAQKTTAIVGASGAGKSTILDLITGILKPTSGTIRFDGTSYHMLDLRVLRTRIGYVTQEVVLFDDTIADNIAFWDQASDRMARVRARASEAHCDFISTIAEREETLVGDRGIRLSVGQRQRITIARELYREPEILLFDEATSALDTDAEQVLQRSIEALHGQKTLVIIAHRLSTIAHADYIYVIDGGRVIEEGSFQALREDQHSRFSHMCALQRI